uniref:Peptide deformylase n=1 Tax=Anolis carolinensis TaxID=28377 RepID=H9G7H1_ANOCA|nr:PREDICTED: peptide deformylase, mitochondrial [Anolis carolinensis]|eukprot:XP_003228472.1 PREDICTED: peptide deformylase, mitochondrial [Anolis carolinensis]
MAVCWPKPGALTALSRIVLDNPCIRSSSSLSSSPATKQRSYWQYLRRKVLKPPVPPFSRVCQVGDPVLRSLAAPVEPSQVTGKDVQALIQRLVRLMRRERCVALSAPQVGIPLQVFVAEYPTRLLEEHPPDVRQARQMAPFPLRVFINPTMRVLDSQVVSHPEGCRSVHGFSACVPRFLAVQVAGLNEAGEESSWEACGWAARIVQHEMDHLQGILYVDRMESRTFTSVRWADVRE